LASLLNERIFASPSGFGSRRAVLHWDRVAVSLDHLELLVGDTGEDIAEAFGGLEERSFVGREQATERACFPDSGQSCCGLEVVARPNWAANASLDVGP
jgi:hypothetical protein